MEWMVLSQAIRWSCGTHRQLIVDLAARFRVPAIYPYRYYVESAASLAYGVDVLT
jgi:hypothetical protein